MSECYLPGIPIWLKKPMLDVGSAIGAALGMDPTFEHYRSRAAVASAMSAAQPAA
jgi:hypothetical protein